MKPILFAARLSDFLVPLLLAMGLLLVGHGLLAMDPAKIISWTHGGVVNYTLTLAILAIISFGGGQFLKRSPFVIAAGLAMILALATNNLWPLLLVIWFAIAAWLAGRCVCRNQPALVQLLAGAALYGTLTGLLVHLPVNYPALYALLLAMPLVLGYRRLPVLLSPLRDWFSLPAPTVRPLIERLLESAIGALLVMYLIVGFMPELGYDAQATHLFIPSQVALLHRWGFDAGTYVWAVMPMLADWLYTIAYMLAGETGARLLNVGGLLVLTLLVRALVNWVAPAGTDPARLRLARLAAMLLLLATPLSFTEATTLFIETIWASFFVGGTLVLLEASARRDFNSIVPAGLLLGAAAAAKAVTLPMLPVLALPIFLTGTAWLRPAALRPLLLMLALLAAVGIVPYLTAYVLTDNPVFPLFNAIFRSPFYPAVNFDSAGTFSQGLRWDTAYGVVFRADRYMEAYTGIGGLQWLLLFPAAFCTGLIHKPQRRALLLLAMAVIMIAAVFHSVAYVRYIYPCYALVAAALAGALLLPPLTALARKAVWVVFGLTVIGNLCWLNAGSFYADFPLQSLLSPAHRADYLRRRNPVTLAVAAVNAMNGAHTPVAIFGPPYGAGLNATALYANWYNGSFVADTAAAADGPALATALFRRNVEFILLETTTGDLALRDRVIAASDLLQTIGTIDIRRVKPGPIVWRELLQNPDFAKLDGWSQAHVPYDAAAHSVTVSSAHTMTQAVAVIGGQRYRNAITARCLPGTPVAAPVEAQGEAQIRAQGRVQVNWLDAAGTFIDTDISVFPCTADWQRQEAIVTAPPKAAMGIVYVGGHTAQPLQVDGASFEAAQ